MKYSKTILAGATMLLAAAITSLALAQTPEFGERMNKFLNDHPDVAAKVRADPSLLMNRQFRHEHPELQTFMQNHPNDYRTLEAHGIGAYDSNHVWRDENWWHQNHPDWMYQNHPEWAANHPDWKADENAHPEWFRHPVEAMHHEEAVHHEERVHRAEAQAAAHQHHN
jgi:hypothetical protein